MSVDNKRLAIAMAALEDAEAAVRQAHVLAEAGEAPMKHLAEALRHIMEAQSRLRGEL
jgi:hypothetical protein